MFTDIESEGASAAHSSSYQSGRPAAGDGAQYGARAAPGGVQSAQPNKNLQQTQAQVNEVVGIMRNNMEKVLERDEKLSELDTRADQLQVGAQQFQTTATRIKRKYWWQNIKMALILGGIIVVIIIIIIVAIVTSTQKK
jgi:t-SNARE complex subunit (syntaxin)